MAQFEELQELWQSQNPPMCAVPSAGELTAELRRYGHRQNLINSAKLCLLGFMVWTCLRPGQAASAISITGLVIITGSALVYLIVDWRHQLGIARLDFTEPSHAFVHTAIEQLYQQRNPFRGRGWIILVTMGIGVDMLWWHRPNVSPNGRVGLHALAAALPVITYLLGTTIRRFRWKRECLPLVERLWDIERALAENYQ